VHHGRAGLLADVLDPHRRNDARKQKVGATRGREIDA
jgi:hypothetical protein